MKIGTSGSAKMEGRPASRRQRQHALAVYDPNNAAVQRLVDQGATGSSSASELAAQCEVILLCLPTSDHVRSVILVRTGLRPQPSRAP